MAMTPDAVARAWFKEVWDEGREDAIDRLADPEMVVHGLAGPDSAPLRGPAAFKQNVFSVFREALGDLEIAVQRTVTEGEMCAAHCLVKGRHVGHGLGGAPTGEPVTFEGMTILRVRNGRIVEGWNCFDFLTMYQQMRWVKTPPAP
jgi:predicted ester cyclase